VLEVGGLKLGVVGLANVDTAAVTDPRHVVGLEFQPYEVALNREVPKVRAAGAEQVIVLLHDRVAAAQELVPALRALGVRAIGAGHAHRSGAAIDPGPSVEDNSDDVVICNGGPYLRSYCRIDLLFVGDTLVERKVMVPRVERAPSDPAPAPPPAVAAIVDDARKRADKRGNEVLARSSKPIGRADGALGQLIVDSWLEALPFAQVAITNAGGLRQDIARGKVRVRDVVGVMPFNNFLLVIELTGAQLKEALENQESIAAGVKFTYRVVEGRRLIEEIVKPDGKRLGPDERVKVVVNDFMYRGGDHYKLRSYDPEPEETAIDWREPVFRKLRTLAEGKKKIAIEADERAKLVK
jgi:2',3'-cyclic-nucleotide 2'-phosphodiesterase (5'-nucleotidase family)